MSNLLNALHKALGFGQTQDSSSVSRLQRGHMNQQKSDVMWKKKKNSSAITSHEKKKFPSIKQVP